MRLSLSWSWKLAVALAVGCAALGVSGCSNKTKEAAEFCRVGMEGLAENDLASATECFVKSLELVPDFVPALVGLGETRLRSRQYVEAESAFSKALAVDAR
jgi:Tfp pilus assembly protein PilF